MTQYWKFYIPAAHPTGLDSQVGGVISSTELEPQLNYLFSPMETDDLSDKTQYRKVFAKQVQSATFSNVYIEVANVEYTGQISFALDSILTGTADNALTIPDGYTTEDFTGNSSTALLGLSSSTLGSTIGIWVKQDLAANAGTDDLASFTLRVRASKT